MNAQSPDPRHIHDLDRYFLQYLPIVRRGKRQIFVTALCNRPTSEEWRSHLYVVVDGGDCFWQAYYDPAIREFSNLIMHGRP